MTTYNVALNFEDGVTRVIQCDDDEKVTDAAFRQKINLPMDCRDGVCGTCKCFAEKGEYELEFYMDESMSDEEAEQGYVAYLPDDPRKRLRRAGSGILRRLQDRTRSRRGRGAGRRPSVRNLFRSSRQAGQADRLPAWAVCERNGSRCGKASVLLLLLCAGGARGKLPDPQPARRCDEQLSRRTGTSPATL